VCTRHYGLLWLSCPPGVAPVGPKRDASDNKMMMTIHFEELRIHFAAATTQQKKMVWYDVNLPIILFLYEKEKTVRIAFFTLFTNQKYIN